MDLRVYLVCKNWLETFEDIILFIFDNVNLPISQ